MDIPFEKEYRQKYYDLIEDIFESNFWSGGKALQTFEEKFSEYVGLGSRAVANGGSGLLSILNYIDVRGKDVIVPANTFWATTQAAKLAGANVIYADCNKDDLCLSYDDLVSKVTDNTKAVIMVHIGGHIAFEIEKIAQYCEDHSIELVEDCAHVHGGSYKGKQGGHFGIAGSYSFYATKTMPTGDGGMVVSKNQDLLDWLSEYRNYGKRIVDGVVTYPITEGFNYRMSDFVAALGIVQLERLPKIIEWKRELAAKYDQIFDNRVKLPEEMESGYYKYITFGYDLNQVTGQVFGPLDQGYRIDGKDFTLPNSEWVTQHHKCAPIYYGWEHAGKSVAELESILLK